MPKRIEYIDIAKGIGILLVVMGHNDFTTVSPLFYKIIYSFHMPLFFFISGTFFNKELSFASLSKKRFQTLIKPYMVITLFIYFVTISFSKVNIDTATIRLIKTLYANSHYIDWGPLWFLPHLFALNIFSYFFYKTTKLIKIKNIEWIMLVVLQVLGISILSIFWPFNINLLGRIFTLYGLPLSIDIILVSGFFFILGSEVKKSIPDDFFDNPIILFGSGTIFFIMILVFPQTIDFDARFFESLPINTLESIMGIVFILAISKKIALISKLSSVFRYIGNASLIILIFHLPIQEAFGEKFLHIFNNQIVSYWLAYFCGVIFPILINIFLIRPNPIVRSWFGFQPIGAVQIQATQAETNGNLIS
jgi:fucose 4-O-acetylase-like acetyltransferase